MADESFTETLAEGSALEALHQDTPAPNSSGGEGEGKGAEAGNAPPGTAPNPELQALKDRIEQAERRAFEADQRATFYQGQVARESRQGPAPAEKPFDREAFKSRLATNPEEAILEAAEEIAARHRRELRGELSKELEGKVGQTQRIQELRSALEREGAEVARDYAELIGRDSAGKPLNEAFDRDCFEYAQRLAAQAGNALLQSGEFAGSRVLTPGQMRAAADAVYGRWAREGKLPAPAPKSAAAPVTRSLRELIEQVPRSDNLGSNGAARTGAKPSNGAVSTLEDLQRVGYFKSDKEVRAARNYARQMGWPEKDYVDNIKEVIRNGEVDNGD